MKDRAVPVLAALLVALLVGARLGGDAPLVPTAPGAVAAALVAVVGIFAAVVVPTTRAARPAHVLAAFVVATPAAVAVHRVGGPFDVPAGFLALAAAGGFAAAAGGRKARAAAVVATTMLLGGGAALDAAGVAVVPATLRAPAAPFVAREAADDLPAAGAAALVPTPWTKPSADAAPRRVGRFTRAPEPLSWPVAPPPGAAARFVPVPEGAVADVPRAGPAVFVVGAAEAPVLAGAASVRAGPWKATDARDLDAFDVLVLRDGGDDPRTADVVAAFARRGGLLVGPPASRPWPQPLGRRLGPEAPSSSGVAAAVGVGAGHVARAEGMPDVEALLAAGLHRPRLFTAFDGATSPPPPPRGARRFVPDDGPGHDLWTFAAVATAVLALAATWLRRRLVELTVLAALSTLEVALLPAPATGPTVDAVVLEPGGPGGRRVEAYLVAAGPRGWVGPAGPGLASSEAVRWLGFRVLRDGDALRPALAPDATGWIVVERTATGDTSGLAPIDEFPAWATSLVGRTGHVAIGGRAFAGEEEGPAGLASPAPGLPPPERVRTLVLRPR